MRQNARPNIHLYIDRLILDGLSVDRTQAPHLQTAVEKELTRLLVANGLFPDLQSGGAVPGIHANAIELTAARNPAEMGTQIAQSIYSGISEKR
jgi:hypothetical protein